MTNFLDFLQPTDDNTISLKDVPEWKVKFIKAILSLDESIDHVALATIRNGNEPVRIRSEVWATGNCNLDVLRDFGNLFFQRIDQLSEVFQEHEVVSNLDSDIPKLVEPWKREAAKAILNFPLSVPHKCFMLSEDNSQPLVFLQTIYHSDLNRLRIALDKLSNYFFSTAEVDVRVRESATSHIVDENVVKLNYDPRDYFATETQRVLNSDQKITGYFMATWLDDGTVDTSTMIDARRFGVLDEYIRFKISKMNESESTQHD